MLLKKRLLSSGFKLRLAASQVAIANVPSVWLPINIFNLGRSGLTRAANSQLQNNNADDKVAVSFAALHCSLFKY